MALLTSVRSHRLGRPPIEEVLSPREFGRVGGLLVGTGALLGAIAMAAVALAGSSAAGPGFHPAVVWCLCGVAVAGALLMVVQADRLFPKWTAAQMAAAVTLIAAVAYFLGPRQAPFATLFFVWVGTGFVLLPPLMAALEVAYAALADAVVLGSQRGHPAAFSAWVFTVGVISLTAWVVKRVVDALTDAAGGERAARAAAQRANAELEDISRRETEFLGRISHELRTPLNVIIGFADMLGDGMVGPLNEKQAEYAGEVQASGRHLLGLIGDVLDVTKVEEGREDLVLVEFALSGVLGPAVGLFGPEAERSGIRLALVEPDTPIVMRGDERKIRQVVLNLLSNAVKFTPRGGSVTVSASVHNGQVTVSVADTGPGIAPSDLERVFEEYRQATSSGAPGTGLGLPLARRFAEQHDGSLDVASVVGGGSTFSLRVPVTGPAARRTEPSPAVDAADEGLPAVLDPRVLRTHMAFLPPILGLGAVGLGLLTLVVDVAHRVPGYRPVPLAVLAAVAISVAAAVGIRGRPLSVAGMSALLALATVGFTLCDYYAGLTQQPYGAMLYVWIGVAAMSFLSRRAAVVHTLFVGACYGVLLAVQHGNSAPVGRWLVVVGVVVVSTISVDTLVGRLGSLAEGERRARLRLETVHGRLEAANRHKSQFLATMSHELRTPLNAIIGFSDVLQDELFGPLSDKQREYAHDLAEAGQQLLALINDVLDLAKVDAHRMELQLTEDVDVRTALDAACTPRRPVPVEVVASDLRPMELDEHKFRRIVSNLIDEVVSARGTTRAAVAAASSSAGLTVDVSSDHPRGGDAPLPLRVAVASALAELHGGRVEGSTHGWRLTLPLRALSREPV